MGTIDSFRGPYFFLSNFFPCSVEYEGITYATAEGAFQAAKTLDVKQKVLFQNLSGKEAKHKGYKVCIREDWDIVKYRIMYEIVKAKFTQNEDLRKRLIATGDWELIEDNTWGDTTWGKCRGEGTNGLGIILMKVREELR